MPAFPFLFQEVDEAKVGQTVVSLPVRGQCYQGQMPAFGTALDDEKLAAIITYARSQWGNQASPVTPELVAQIRETEKGRKQPWQGEAELRKRLGKLAPP